MPQTPILVPLLNANEPEARLVEIHAKDGALVQIGDLLFTVETTKAASDVESTAAGYFRLISEEGATLQVGDLLAVITPTADEAIESGLSPQRDSVAVTASPVDGLRITRPARELAERLKIDLAALPTDQLITESLIKKLAGVAEINLPDYNENHLIIYGGGGHAKAVLEMAQAMGGFEIAGIVDDGLATETKVLGVPVLGSGALLSALKEHGLMQAANGVGGILDINIRVKLFERMAAAGLNFPALIHPRATIEPSAKVGAGVQVFANAYVGSSAVLHERCMVNTNAVVSHDCEIGRFSHIAPGALLAGHVIVGEKVLIGMGVTTAIGIKIGNGARIGNGAILYADVPERAMVQAGKVWDGKVN